MQLAVQPAVQLPWLCSPAVQLAFSFFPFLKEDVEKTKRKTATRATEGGDQEGKASEEAESEIDRRVPTFIRKATTTSGVGWSGLLSAIMWNHAEKKYYVRNLPNKDRIQQVVQRPFCVTYFAYR